MNPHMRALVALAVVPLVALAASHRARARNIDRPASGRTWAQVGVLSAPSSVPPADIARAYLAADPTVLAGAAPASLSVRSVASVRGGTLVRLAQEHRGLRVVGGAVSVRIDDRGQVRWVASNARAMPAALSIVPLVTVDAAIGTVARSAGYGERAIDAIVVRGPERAARLVIYASPSGAPHLAYEVVLPRDLARMQTIRGYVDAHAGTLLRRENLVRSGVASPTANVYEVNPVETPDLSVVPLTGLAGGATRLVNDDVLVQNCVDQNECIDVFGDFMHSCTPVVAAAANADGNFTDYTFESDTAFGDEFAEVQMFFHATKVYAKVRELGFASLASAPILAIANFTFPDFDSVGDCNGTAYTGSGTPMSFDNAFFAPDGQGFLSDFGQDALVFGQGSVSDFAYDGDVVYHEFGHALMFTVAPDVGFGYVDEFGFDITQAGLHEGYADLVTLWLTDDPEIGEYAGKAFGGAIRDLTATNTCPGDLIGESHEDSLPMTTAIFAARTAVATTPEDRATFDGAVLTAQRAFDAFTGFEQASALTLMEMETAFDANTAAMVETEMAARGANGCNNRVIDGTTTKAEYNLAGEFFPLPGFVQPGPFQYRYEVTEHARDISLFIGTVDAFFEPGDVQVDLVMKDGDDPIRWDTSGPNPVGDYDHIVRVVVEPNLLAIGRFIGSFPPGVYHLQLVNRDADVTVRNSHVEHTVDPNPPPPDAGADGGDAGADDDGGGCGCTAGGAGPQVPVWLGGLGLCLLGLFGWRRRR